MNPSPISSPIASPIPSNRPTATPIQSALAAQIGVLTHLVDRMERFHSAERGNPASTYVEGEIAVLHSAIDALNALYETDLNEVSENRRAKWLLRDILRDLPVKRDWLNPDTERNARALVGSRADAPAPMGWRERDLRTILGDLLLASELNTDELDESTRLLVETARRMLAGKAVS